MTLSQVEAVKYWGHVEGGRRKHKKWREWSSESVWIGMQEEYCFTWERRRERSENNSINILFSHSHSYSLPLIVLSVLTESSSVLTLLLRTWRGVSPLITPLRKRHFRLFFSCSFPLLLSSNPALPRISNLDVAIALLQMMQSLRTSLSLFSFLSQSNSFSSTHVSSFVSPLSYSSLDEYENVFPQVCLRSRQREWLTRRHD